MAAEPTFVPVALCEVCWLIEHTDWEPESMDEDGQILMRLTGIDVPEKVNTDSVDVCCDCGSITIAGIYEFRNPETLNFPPDSQESEENSVFENDDPTSFTFSLKDFDEQLGDDL